MQIFCILGGGKLQLHALVPLVLERSDSYVFVTTTSEHFKEIQEILAEGDTHTKYSILYTMKDETLNDVKTRMKKNNIRVAIINTLTPVFKEVLKACDGGYYLSACRDGLFSYIPYIAKASTKPTKILCFDNDEKMVAQAKEACRETTLSVYKCVAHSICSSITFDVEKKQCILHGGREKFLYFPPEVKDFENLLSNSAILSNRVQTRFASNSEEFCFFINSKLINVNALHTLLCVIAYKEAAEQSIPLDVAAKMRFAELLNMEKTIDLILKVHSILFDKLLSEVANKLGEVKEIHSETCSSFIKYLFTEQEIISRGLDISSASAYAKKELHFPILHKASNIAEVKNVLDFFERELQKI